MAEVNISINGRTFGISCEDGQERRVTDLAHYVDSRLKEIARAGAAASESHLLVLTNLMLADEIFDLRGELHNMAGHIDRVRASQQEEEEVASAIGVLAERIERIASRIQNA